MVDEIYDRNYQAGRAEMNRDIDKALASFGRGIAHGFRVLARTQFAAPWSAQGKRARLG